MKKFLCSVVMIVMSCHFLQSAPNPSRYKDIVFRELKIDSVVYGTHRNKHLLMDLYQPVGDTARLRPLVILAHGGAFLRGDKRCEKMPVFCRELAMRGFVVASIDYRLTT